MNNSKERNIITVNEQFVRNKIYVIRGQKVMIDSDLASIYGYSTKAFNQQVKNNIDKFDEDFMFQLTSEEFISLHLASSPSARGGTRYLPYAFTEEGVYMLMTVLKGELATIQTKALIRTFKKMKDYIFENQDLLAERSLLRKSLNTTDSISNNLKLRSDIDRLDAKITEMSENLNETIRSEVSDILNEFNDSRCDRSYLFMDNELFKADAAYDRIYGQARETIYIVDNYVNIRTLEKLINVPRSVKISIFTNNTAKGLRRSAFEDFCKEYPELNVNLFYSGKDFHDRYIVLDYNTRYEKFYSAGTSSKDCGLKVTSIYEMQDREKYDQMIEKLLKCEPLKLN